MIRWLRWNYLFAMLWFIAAHLVRTDGLINFCLTCLVVHLLLMLFGVLFLRVVE